MADTEDFYKIRNAGPTKVVMDPCRELGSQFGQADNQTPQDYKNKEINTFPRLDKETTGPK